MDRVKELEGIIDDILSTHLCVCTNICRSCQEMIATAIIEWMDKREKKISDSFARQKQVLWDEIIELKKDKRDLMVGKEVL